MIKIITLVIFILSLVGTIERVFIFFSKNRGLTERGYKQLGLFITLLIISSLQMFGIFDFVNYFRW